MPHPIVQELRQTALTEHERLLTAMLRGDAGDALAEAQRVLRVERTRLNRRYLRELERGFDTTSSAPRSGPDSSELQRLSLEASEALEERLALDLLVASAQQTYRATLARLERRLLALAHTGVAVSPFAFSPAVAVGAFRSAIESLDIAFAARLLLYKRYEHSVLGNLAQVHDAALAVFERHPATADAALDAAPLLPSIDLATQRSLQRAAASGPDAALAASLLDCLQDPEAHPAGVAIAQRLALAGQLCNELFAQADLPRAYCETLTALRMPLIKLALSDQDFFINAWHPVRLLLRDTAEAGHSAPVVGAAAVAESERGLRRLIERIDVSPAFVEPQLAALTPLGAEPTAAFLDQLREQDQTRREALLTRVRRIVAQQFERITLGHPLPAGTRLFLRNAWGPLLTLRLLRQGIDSPAWAAGLRRLEDLLAALSDSGTRVRDFETLLNRLAADLFDAGMQPEKFTQLLQALREAFDEIRSAPADAPPAAAQPEAPLETVLASADAPGRTGLEDFEPPPAELVATPLAGAAPAEPDLPLDIELQPLGWTPADADDAPPATPAQLLARLLVPGAWFCVYDPARQQAAWLKLSDYDSAAERAVFHGFDQQHGLALSGPALLADLLAGRSEPIAPAADALKAWRELQRLARAGN